MHLVALYNIVIKFMIKVTKPWETIKNYNKKCKKLSKKNLQ